MANILEVSPLLSEVQRSWAFLGEPLRLLGRRVGRTSAKAEVAFLHATHASAMAEPGSPMPDVFEALSTAALQKLRNSQGFARPPWAVVCEARCTAAHQKLQL